MWTLTEVDLLGWGIGLLLIMYHLSERACEAPQFFIIAPVHDCIAARAQQSALPKPYATLCSGCHGERATGTERGPGLVDNRSCEAVREADPGCDSKRIHKGGMPPFALPDEQTLIAGDLGSFIERVSV